MPSAPAAVLKLSATAIAIGLLVGCSSSHLPKMPTMPEMPKIPGIYRIDIQQGNVVSQDMLNRLEKGMEKRKVRLILGTPLITDTFHQDRWDYIYSFRKGAGEATTRHITLRFKQDRLTTIEGDVRTAATRHEPTRRKETVVTVPPRKEEGGFLKALTPGFLNNEDGGILKALTPGFLKKDTATAKKAVPAKPTAEADNAPAANAQTASVVQSETTDAKAKEKDRSLLRRLFSGFGGASERAGGENGDGHPRQDSPPAGNENSAQTATVVPSAATEDEAKKTAAKNEDDGFFTRLLKRFKLPKKDSEQPQDGAPDAPPAAQPAE